LFLDRVSDGALRAARLVAEQGGLVFFEPNTAGRASLAVEAFGLANVVKVSAQRLTAIGGFPSVSQPGQVQVITDSYNGLRWRIGNSEWLRAFGFEAERVADSAGAGDWTTAGMIAALLKLLPTQRMEHIDPDMFRQTVSLAVRVGQALATTSLGYVGARGMSFHGERGSVLEVCHQLIGHTVTVWSSKPAGGAWHRAQLVENCSNCGLTPNRANRVGV
jgi:fructokinase